MNRKQSLAAAALAALAMGGCASAGDSGGGRPVSMGIGAKRAVEADKKGECWGVNECKGKGACGGVGHECAGGNACKGQGWLSLTKTACDEKHGTFKAG